MKRELMTTTELYRRLGVSRRVLQDYEELGLINRAGKDESGKCLYSTDCMGTVMLVQIFAKAGYARKEIKEILRMSDTELAEEFDRAARRLTKERNRLDAMINELKGAKYIATMSEEKLIGIAELDYKKVLDEKNFNQRYEDILRIEADMIAEEDHDDDDEETDRAWCELWLVLSSIALHKDKSPENPVVQSCMNAFEKSAESLFIGLEFKEEGNVPVIDYAEVIEFTEGIANEFLNDNNLSDLIVKLHGEEGLEFIGKAVNAYVNRQRNGGKEEE